VRIITVFDFFITIINKKILRKKEFIFMQGLVDFVETYLCEEKEIF